MIELLQLATSTFWTFCGVVIIINLFLYFIINGIIRIVVRFTRMMMVRKHGWPPIHLDADGDWKNKPEQNIELD